MPYNKLIFKEEAKKEIEQSYFYYESKQVGLGDRFMEVLYSQLEDIQQYPLHFPEKDPPFREAVLKKYPFIVVFEVFNKDIIVYAVFNTWQNPTKKPR